MLTYFFQGKKLYSPPSLSGIYIIIRENKIWYIGLTKNFASRVNRNHWVIRDLYSTAPTMISIYLLPLELNLLASVEAMLIALIKPIYNNQKKQ